MKGMIILGYPGIGKTTLALSQKDIIDLNYTPFKSDSEYDAWETLYCQVAMSLAKSDKTVFVSCHDEVQSELNTEPYKKIRKYIIVPHISLKESWLKRITSPYYKRYGVDEDQHQRMVERVRKYFEVDIKHLASNEDFTMIYIQQPVTYNLADIVYHIQKLQAAL